jgi:hypothetical protein
MALVILKMLNWPSLLLTKSRFKLENQKLEVPPLEKHGK